MRRIRSLCVYCGSREGTEPQHGRAAAALGAGLAARGISLIYGAGGIGLMNVVANAVIAGGGVAIGVIPRHLAALELKHTGLTETVLVETMHERKQHMFERADGFAVLPGGFGTLDELFEMLTWKMLGLHHKPIFLVNSTGYWDPLVTLIDQIIGEGFAPAETRKLLVVVPSVEALFEAIDETTIGRAEAGRADLA
ncbi:MAG: TIGR00730 family Rossman fold protein [Alphaproteobacteria bacterium]